MPLCLNEVCAAMMTSIIINTLPNTYSTFTLSQFYKMSPPLFSLAGYHSFVLCPPPPPRPWGAGLACYALSLLLFTLSSPVLFTPWLLPLALSASSCTSFHALPFHHSFMLTPDSFFMLFPFNLSAYFVSSSPLTCLLFIPLFPLYSPRPPPNPL